LFVVIRLVLGVVFLVLGAGMILWNWMNSNRPWLVIRGTHFSAGWLLVLFGLYDVVRWWSYRSARRAEGQPQDRPTVRRGPTTGPREPDPRFDFDRTDGEEEADQARP
jgi:hypothetical protein